MGRGETGSTSFVDVLPRPARPGRRLLPARPAHRPAAFPHARRAPIGPAFVCHVRRISVKYTTQTHVQREPRRRAQSLTRNDRYATVDLRSYPQAGLPLAEPYRTPHLSSVV